jgi:small subunit ribosomal protein S4
MSRYTGPTWKVSRRLGYSILETGVELKKRAYGPGPHAKDKKKKPSEYGKQLIEKQKLRETYGVSERQFQRLFLIAKSTKGAVTGVVFMQILESRLDNLVYRMGFANTRRQARQLVNHGHITVNGKKVDIPSYLVNVGDVIAVKEKSKNLVIVKNALEASLNNVAYVEVNKEEVSGKFIRLPERNELTKQIDESQIVEFYNRKL